MFDKSNRAVTLLIVCFVTLFYPALTFAQNQKGIVHNPIAALSVGERATLKAVVSDDSGVDVVRAYFKHESGANYLFVNLNSTDSQSYMGEIPAPSIANSTFEYLLLVKNSAGQVYKSQVYTVNILQGVAKAATAAPIAVYTELAQAPRAIQGFSDNLTLDITESGAKYGVIAELYGSSSAGSATVGSGLSNTGSVTATTTSSSVAGGALATSGVSATSTTVAAAGLSTTAVVSGVAIAGGLAAAASGGSDSDDSGGPTPTDPPQPPDYNGTYTVELDGALIDNVAGDCSSSAQVRFSNVNLSVSSGTITLDFDTGTMTGSISGADMDIQEGTLDVILGTPGFNSTDAISWQAFDASFSSETAFSSDTFSMVTSEFGVDECAYNASLTGSR